MDMKSVSKRSIFNRESQWFITFRRFKRSKVALVGLVFTASVVFMAVFADFVAPYDPYDLSGFLEGKGRESPSSEHLFGTDRLGRDVFSMVIHGSRVALYIGLLVIVITSCIGIPCGVISGYFGGKVDEVMMRITESFMMMPSFLFILFILRILYVVAAESGVSLIALILGIFGWPGLARVVRAETLRIKELEFIEASKCIGASKLRIIFRHIVPNALPPVIVLLTFGIAGTIVTEATISFLGFGDPMSITWGRMIALGQDAIRRAWWESVFPGIALFFTVLGFNFLGDGLVDALNPRLRQ